MNTFLINLGLTRDSWVWGWSRWVAFCALIISGVVPLDQYLSPKFLAALKAIALLTVLFAGKYDSSPLPGKK